MTIKQRIDSDLKLALLAGEKDRATTLRGLKSAILNVEIASNSRDTGLPDDQIVQVLNKELKKRVESAEMYIQGGSPERADKELQEKTIIMGYLPAQLSEDDLKTLIDSAIKDLGQETDPTNPGLMGSVIGEVKKRAAGQADGATIARLVKEKLS